MDVHETIRHCDQCKGVYASEELIIIVPDSAKFGFDVIEYVGKALYLEHRTDEEIRDSLIKNNVNISLSEIPYLGKKFILYLSIAHRESTPKIKEMMYSKGGYILHCDGTTDGANPHLMSVMDGLADIVLGNIKCPTESKAYLIPFLEEIKETFGVPICTVSDMSAAILTSINEVFPGIQILICHYHFLRDLGKDLFGTEDTRLFNAFKKQNTRSSLRRLASDLKKKIEKDSKLAMRLNLFQSQELGGKKIQPEVSVYTLIQWILDYPNELSGYGFPFDRKNFEFYQRLRDVKEKITSYQLQNRTFQKLNSILNDILLDPILERNVETMKKKIKHFDQLRNAMRIALPEGAEGLNDDGNDEDMNLIKESVTTFRYSIEIQRAALKDSSYKKMLEQIEKYWDKLFADPITVALKNGEKVKIQPQRTNNIMERFFRDLNRGNRRKTGNKNLGRALRAMLANTPLIKNLENEEYLKIILNGKDSLHERFAEIDAKLVREEMKKNNEHEKLSPKMKKLIRMPNLPADVVQSTALKLRTCA